MASFQDVINSDKPVLVDFYASWCEPCKMMSPILKQVKDQLGEKATIIKIDVDKNSNAAKKFNIQGVPSLLLFKNGHLKWRQSGVIPFNQIINIINQYC